MGWSGSQIWTRRSHHNAIKESFQHTLNVFLTALIILYFLQFTNPPKAISYGFKVTTFSLKASFGLPQEKLSHGYRHPLFRG